MAYNSFCKHPLTVLCDSMVGRVHEQVLRLLEQVGVKVTSDESLDLFEDIGVHCDREGQRVYPKEHDVQRALESVGREYSVFGRHPEAVSELRIDMKNSFTVSGAAAIKLYEGDRYREAALDDLINMTILHDRLENIDVIINVVEPVDVQGCDLYPLMAAVLFSYTTKPLLLQAGGRADLKKIIRMGSLFTGGAAELEKRPVFMTGANAELPLHITQSVAEVLIDAARANIPSSLGCYVMAGSTGPFDVLSSLVQRTAVVLTGLILTQAARPGSSYTFTCHSGCSDLKTGDVITMSPMAMQLIAGSVQMGRFYNLTTNALSATESKQHDSQASAERMFSLATCLMAGASMVMGTTSQMSGMELADFEQCVIDNEIAGYLFDFIKGCNEGEIQQSVETISEVETSEDYQGIGFLAHPTTLKHCRMPRYSPDLFSCGMLSRWLAGDRRELVDKAKGRVQDLLQDNTCCVSEDLKNELYAIARGHS